jgi:hypothetical protein
VLYCDLLRVTVLLVAGVASVLGAVSVVVANSDGDTTALIVAGAWWLVAALTGLLLGRTARAAEAVGPVLAAARTATSLPPESPARIALLRLWPIAVFAVGGGIAGWIWPQVAAIGAGFAIGIALLWRRHEAAVAAIEDRDGVRFYVEASSALEPLKLIRTPGLYRDRAPSAKPPPPPPAWNNQRSARLLGFASGGGRVRRWPGE